MTYAEQLRDARWQVRRLQILTRDLVCVGCGVSPLTNRLEVHHKFYVRGLMAWEYPDSALVSLCRTCHSRERYSTHAMETAERSQERNQKREAMGLPPISGDGKWLDEYGETL